MAVSEPANNGTLTGNVTDGLAYTPGSAAALVDTDIGLNYLVTDTDGHVTQEDITIRILAAGDTNRPGGAGGCGADECGGRLAVFVLGNDFDPDGGALTWWRCRHRPTVT